MQSWYIEVLGSIFKSKETNSKWSQHILEAIWHQVCRMPVLWVWEVLCCCFFKYIMSWLQSIPAESIRLQKKITRQTRAYEGGWLAALLKINLSSSKYSEKKCRLIARSVVICTLSKPLSYSCLSPFWFLIRRPAMLCSWSKLYQQKCWCDHKLTKGHDF